MKREPLNDITRQHLVTLIQANFAGRDDLYAAAEAVDNEALSLICRRLAEDLAGNATELQQIALAAGVDKVDINKFGTQLQADLMSLMQKADGDEAVLEEVEECEQIVQREYDEAIEQSDAPQIADVLAHQRESVTFGKTVVQKVRTTEEDKV